MYKKISLTLLPIIATAWPAHAKSHCNADDDCILINQWQIALAAGWGQRPNPVAAYDDMDLYLIPNIAYYAENWFFDNGNWGYTLTEQTHYSANLTTLYTADRSWFERWDPVNIFIHLGQPLTISDPDELQLVKQRQSRDFTYLGGIDNYFYTTFGQIKASFHHDLFNVHNGSQAELKWRQHWQLNDIVIDLALASTWKSKKLINYYYGFRADENLNIHQTYHQKSGFNHWIELTTRYRFDTNFDILGAVRYTKLAESIVASPLINEEYTTTYFIGALYRF